MGADYYSRDGYIEARLYHSSPEVRGILDRLGRSPETVEKVLGVPARWPGGRLIQPEDFVTAEARETFERTVLLRY